MKRGVFLFLMAAVLVSGCRPMHYDDTLKVKALVDGTLYFSSYDSYDTYFPFHLAETDTSFTFSFSHYVSSYDGDKLDFVLRLDEDEPFELYREYPLDGGAVEGGSYAIVDWVYKSTGGSVTFTDRFDDRKDSYLSGEFEITAENGETGEVVSITAGTFENFHTVR